MIKNTSFVSAEQHRVHVLGFGVSGLHVFLVVAVLPCSHLHAAVVSVQLLIQ